MINHFFDRTYTFRETVRGGQIELELVDDEQFRDNVFFYRFTSIGKQYIKKINIYISYLYIFIFLIGYTIHADDFEPQIVEVSTSLNLQLQINPITGHRHLLPTPAFMTVFNGERKKINFEHLSEDISPFMYLDKITPTFEVFFKIAGTSIPLPDGATVSGQILIKRKA